MSYEPIAWDPILTSETTPARGLTQTSEQEQEQAQPPARGHIDKMQVRSRQADLVDASILEAQITVIGAGAIGSFTVLTLAKMGFTRITVYDGDDVSSANISNQFYRYGDIGHNKAHALLDMVQAFERIGITAHNVMWERTRSLSGFVVMAVDSMRVRKQIYKAVARNSGVFGFVDGRMGGQQAEVYSVDLCNPVHKDIYNQYLWSDTEARELPCTQKAVMYNVLWIASQISNNLRLMLEGKPFPTVMQMDFENVNHINVQQPS